MVIFKDTLSVILLLASQWGDVILVRTLLSLKNNQYRTCQCLFCTHFFVIELRHMLLHWFVFWKIRMTKNTILKEVNVLHLFVISDGKKKKADRHSLRISNEYSVHDQFSTEMIKNTNVHTHTKRHCHDQLSADENKPSTARTSIHPRRKNVDKTHGQAHVQLSNDTQVPTYWRLRLRWPALNHWTRKLTDVYMFAITKTWVMIVYALSICTFKGNSGGDS